MRKRELKDKGKERRLLRRRARRYNKSPKRPPRPPDV